MLGALALAGLFSRKRARGDKVLKRAVTAAVAAQLVQIRRYTPLSATQVKRARQPRDEDTLRLLVANIRQKNRRVDLLLERIANRNPDLLLLLEPNAWWAHQVACLKLQYPYTVEQPLDNTYGMMLFSKLELVAPEILFLVKREVPSVRTRIRLRNGNLFWFYAVHPKPPGRREPDGEIDGSGPRDAELVLIAEDLRRREGPIIVTGDFNDVAWSHTTRRFQRIGGLLDPRVGRGLYNTFHAEYPLLRFPIDHLFHSEHFALVDFGREHYIGSDHFPIFATLSLEPTAPIEQEPPSATASDEKEAARELRDSGVKP